MTDSSILDGCASYYRRSASGGREAFGQTHPPFDWANTTPVSAKNQAASFRAGCGPQIFGCRYREINPGRRRGESGSRRMNIPGAPESGAAAERIIATRASPTVSTERRRPSRERAAIVGLSWTSGQLVY